MAFHRVAFGDACNRLTSQNISLLPTSRSRQRIIFSWSLVQLFAFASASLSTWPHHFPPRRRTFGAPSPQLPTPPSILHIGSHTTRELTGSSLPCLVGQCSSGLANWHRFRDPPIVVIHGMGFSFQLRPLQMAGIVDHMKNGGRLVMRSSSWLSVSSICISLGCMHMCYLKFAKHTCDNTGTNTLAHPVTVVAS